MPPLSACSPSKTVCVASSVELLAFGTRAIKLNFTWLLIRRFSKVISSFSWIHRIAYIEAPGQRALSQRSPFPPRMFKRFCRQLHVLLPPRRTPIFHHVLAAFFGSIRIAVPGGNLNALQISATAPYHSTMPTTPPDHNDFVCGDNVPKRSSNKDKLANDKPPFDSKRRKPKRRKSILEPCLCNCNRPDDRIRLIAHEDPRAAELVFRCECRSCGDEFGCKTRLHPVFVMFRGHICEDCLVSRADRIVRRCA